MRQIRVPLVAWLYEPTTTGPRSVLNRQFILNLESAHGYREVRVWQRRSPATTAGEVSMIDDDPSLIRTVFHLWN